MAIGQMASDTSSHGRPITLRNNARHRRMLVGKPVRRMHRIVDLRLSVAFSAAGNLLQNAVIRFAWIRNAGTIWAESPFGPLLCMGNAGQQKRYCENCPLHPLPVSALGCRFLATDRICIHSFCRARDILGSICPQTTLILHKPKLLPAASYRAMSGSERAAAGKKNMSASMTTLNTMYGATARKMCPIGTCGARRPSWS